MIRWGTSLYTLSQVNKLAVRYMRQGKIVAIWYLYGPRGRQYYLGIDD